MQDSENQVARKTSDWKTCKKLKFGSPKSHIHVNSGETWRKMLGGFSDITSFALENI